MSAPAPSYFDHNARRVGEVPLDVIEFDPEPSIVVEEREITREEFEALFLDALRVVR